MNRLVSNVADIPFATRRLLVNFGAIDPGITFSDRDPARPFASITELDEVAPARFNEGASAFVQVSPTKRLWCVARGWVWQRFRYSTKPPWDEYIDFGPPGTDSTHE